MSQNDEQKVQNVVHTIYYDSHKFQKMQLYSERRQISVCLVSMIWEEAGL